MSQDRTSWCASEPSPARAAVFRLGYRRWLDGLRGVAILLVLAFHLDFLPGGSLGVDIFFVLSGFLITTLLTQEWQQAGSVSLQHFYLRRALRLLPAFLTLLLLYWLFSIWLRPAEAAARRRELLVAACYVANWPMLHKTAMPYLGHTWSLSVEEQFYLFWPVSLYVMLRCNLSRRRIVLAVCAGIVASAALRMGLYALHRTPGPEKLNNIMRLYMGLDTRADSLLVGCLLGLITAWGLLPASRRFAAWSGAASVISVAMLGRLAWNRGLDHSQYYHGLFTAVALMVAILIARLLAAPSRLSSLLLENRPLVATGRISYGLYLYHIPIIFWLGAEDLGWRHPFNTLRILVLTLVAALASYYFIERPFLALKHRRGRRHGSLRWASDLLPAK